MIVQKETTMSLFSSASDNGTTTTGHMYYCPGCDSCHMVYLDRWTISGDLEINPTVSPSILVRYGDGQICHSFIREGKIEYLSDCTHSLAGQTIDMIDIDDY